MVAQRVPLHVVHAGVTLTSVQRKEVSRHHVVIMNKYKFPLHCASQIAKKIINVIISTLRFIMNRESSSKNKKAF
jgi:hypothetical protein